MKLYFGLMFDKICQFIFSVFYGFFYVSSACKEFNHSFQHKTAQTNVTFQRILH